jgi:hypothetical protein
MLAVGLHCWARCRSERTPCFGALVLATMLLGLVTPQASAQVAAGPAVSLSGRILNAQGVGVAGAFVALSDGRGGGNDGQTDASGHFVLVVNPGDYVFSLQTSTLAGGSVGTLSVRSTSTLPYFRTPSLP